MNEYLQSISNSNKFLNELTNKLSNKIVQYIRRCNNLTRNGISYNDIVYQISSRKKKKRKRGKMKKKKKERKIDTFRHRHSSLREILSKVFLSNCIVFHDFGFPPKNGKREKKKKIKK